MIFALCPIVQMSLHLLRYFFSFVFEDMDHSRKYFYFYSDLCKACAARLCCGNGTTQRSWNIILP